MIGLFLLTLLCLVFGGGECVLFNQDVISVLTLRKNIDLSSRVVHIKEDFTLLNNGSVDQADVYVALPLSHAEHLGSIYAKADTRPLFLTPVATPATKEAHLGESFNKTRLFRIHLAIPAFTSVQFTLEYYVGHLVRSAFKTSKFTTPQVVRFSDQGHSISVYPIENQQTFYLVPKQHIHQVTGASFLTSGDELSTYVRTVENLAPMNSGEEAVTLLYQFEKHLGFFHSVHRQIEISTQSSGFVEEIYHFENEAVALNHPFSRVDVEAIFPNRLNRHDPRYFRYPESKTCFKLDAVMPLRAHHLEYFDEIGNVSTSVAHRTDEFLFTRLEPRYPVLGGWKSDWHLRYKLPVSSFVWRLISKEKRHGTQRHRVILSLGFSVVDVFANRMDVSIILPQKVKNVEITASHLMDSNVRVEKYWGWLDFWVPRSIVHVNFGPVFIPYEKLFSDVMMIDFDAPKRSPRDIKVLSIFFICLVSLLFWAAYYPLRTLISSVGKSVCTFHEIVQDIMDARERFTQLLCKTFKSKDGTPLKQSTRLLVTPSLIKTLREHFREMTNKMTILETCSDINTEALQSILESHMALVKLVEHLEALLDMEFSHEVHNTIWCGGVVSRGFVQINSPYQRTQHKAVQLYNTFVKDSQVLCTLREELKEE